MGIEEIFQAIFLILFIGAPFLSIYFTMRFFARDSRTLLITSLYVWLEWLAGFVLIFLFATQPYYLNSAAFITLMAIFAIANPLITVLIMMLSDRQTEVVSLVENSAERRVTKPVTYLQRAFFVNVAAALTILVLFGALVLVGRTIDKFYPRKQEFTLYDS
jgi:hypothetical protein